MYDFSLFSARSLPPLTEDPDSALVCTPGQGEPLCQLDGLWHRVQVQPAYARLPGALRGCWLRRSAAERLLAAAAQLPDGYSLLVLDAWRPVRLQQALYDDFLARLRRENPRTTPWQLEKMCQEFVARPRADALRPAPHATGGAVDLTLCLDGKPVEMGTAFDDFGPLAGRRPWSVNLAPIPRPGTTAAVSSGPCRRRALSTIPGNGGISATANGCGPRRPATSLFTATATAQGCGNAGQSGQNRRIRPLFAPSRSRMLLRRP